jgi:hypothetical protein
MIPEQFIDMVAELEAQDDAIHVKVWNDETREQPNHVQLVATLMNLCVRICSDVHLDADLIWRVVNIKSDDDAYLVEKLMAETSAKCRCARCARSLTVN